MSRVNRVFPHDVDFSPEFLQKLPSIFKFFLLNMVDIPLTETASQKLAHLSPRTLLTAITSISPNNLVYAASKELKSVSNPTHPFSAYYNNLSMIPSWSKPLIIMSSLYSYF
jgi:hypothetical protein